MMFSDEYPYLYDERNARAFVRDHVPRPGAAYGPPGVYGPRPGTRAPMLGGRPQQPPPRPAPSRPPYYPPPSTVDYRTQPPPPPPGYDPYGDPYGPPDPGYGYGYQDPGFEIPPGYEIVPDDGTLFPPEWSGY